MNLQFDTYEYAIGGKMIKGMTELSESYRMLMENNDRAAIESVKLELMQQMARYMIENNLVEFTYQDDPFTFKRKIAVRAYVLPDNHIRIIRSTIKV